MSALVCFNRADREGASRDFSGAVEMARRVIGFLKSGPRYAFSARALWLAAFVLVPRCAAHSGPDYLPFSLPGTGRGGSGRRDQWKLDRMQDPSPRLSDDGACAAGPRSTMASAWWRAQTRETPTKSNGGPAVYLGFRQEAVIDPFEDVVSGALHHDITQVVSSRNDRGTYRFRSLQRDSFKFGQR